MSVTINVVLCHRLGNERWSGGTPAGWTAARIAATFGGGKGFFMVYGCSAGT